MKLSLHATTIAGTIFAAVCFSVAITGFVSMGDIQDAGQLSDAKGFAWPAIDGLSWRDFVLEA